MKKIIAVGLALLGTILISANASVYLSGLTGPENLVFDGKGVLYVTDTDHLWKVNPDKTLEKLYTRDKDADSTSLAGIVISRDGSVIFSAGNRLLRLGPMGKISEYAKGFKFANGLAIDESDNIFVADSNDKKILVVTPDQKTSVLVKDQGAVNGLEYQQKTMRLYFTSMFSGKVGYVQLAPGLEVEKIVEVAKLGIGLDDMAMDEDGTLYVCQYMKGKIFAISPDGKTEVLIEGIKGPSSVVAGKNEKNEQVIYILEKGDNMKFDGTSILYVKVSQK
jgi:sugar lactone lactonase YvrE